jgi:diguanylate cyclase (GGDEF)-like protein
MGEVPNLSAIARGHFNDPAALALRIVHLINSNPVGAAEALAAMMIESKKDALTGLFNKGHFMDELSHDRREDKGDVLLMVDLDGFKPINDNFGHAAGDRALQEVGKMLLKNIRESDIVGRLGGDEFGVILHGADEKCAQRKAEKIQKELSSGVKFVWGDVIITVRGSVGVYKIQDGQSPEEAMAGADKVMYGIKQAKGDTRHQLVAIEPSARLAR